MATEYKHEKDGGDFKIFRNDDHVATFDPVTEEVTYTHGNDKYAGPVAKEVNAIKATPPTEGTPVETPTEGTPVETPTEGTPVETPTETPTGNALDEANAEIARLETELADARRVNELVSKENAELRGTRKTEQVGANRVPERYVDTVDDSKAPAQDPSLGDLTPAYINWARNGGMAPEVFVRRYKGRIKDLSIPSAANSGGK